MKSIKYGVLALMAIFCGCSQNTVEPVQPTQEVSEGNVVFKFKTSAVSAIATRSTAETSNILEPGSASEYAVNNVTVYLYDAKSKLFAKSLGLHNLNQEGADAEGNIVYTSDRMLVPQGIYDIFAVANSSKLIKAETEEEFLANVDGDTYGMGRVTDISAGVVMTNRGSDNLNTKLINATNEKTLNVVNISLERVLARVDVGRSKGEYELYDDNNNLYAKVSLDGFSLVNLPVRYYSFRHVATLGDLTEPEWDVNTNFGRVPDANGYVIDPYFFKKPISAEDFTNDEGYFSHFFGSFGSGENALWSSFKAVTATPQYTTAYSLENCSLQAAQKNGYSTGVVFRASVTPNNNVYTLDASNKLVLADPNAYAAKLYYYENKFYTSIAALAKTGMTVGDDMTDDDLDYYDVKRFVRSDEGKYYCYYNYWIRHLNNNDPLVMGVMEFGVVRNNLYRLLITNISDLGMGLPAVNTDTPDEGETYLKVQVNVKPWIVRSQEDIIL